MHRAATLVLLIAVAAPLSACGGSSAPATSHAGSALRAAILSAIRAHDSLHYVDVGRGHGLQQTIVGDIAMNHGIQRVRFRLYGQPGEYELILIEHTVYLLGDATAFSYFGFPMQADKYAGRWVSLADAPAFNTAYASDLTLGSFASDHVPRHNLRLAAGGAGLTGTSTVPGLTSRQRLRDWIYVRSTTRPLPIKGNTVDLTTTFTDSLTIRGWNEPVVVHAPSHAVPFRLLVRR